MNKQSDVDYVYPQTRVQCAWCQSVMREGDAPVSHGICGECYEKQLATLGLPATESEKETGRRMDRERHAQSQDVKRRKA
jgi:hypothetical protein